MLANFFRNFLSNRDNDDDDDVDDNLSPDFYKEHRKCLHRPGWICECII